MNRIREFFAKIPAFFGEVTEQMRKCVWPARSELAQSTIVVIVSLAILGAWVGICDMVLFTLLDWIA